MGYGTIRGWWAPLLRCKLILSKSMLGLRWYLKKGNFWEKNQTQMGCQGSTPESLGMGGLTKILACVMLITEREPGERMRLDVKPKKKGRLAARPVVDMPEEVPADVTATHPVLEAPRADEQDLARQLLMGGVARDNNRYQRVTAFTRREEAGTKLWSPRRGGLTIDGVTQTALDELARRNRSRDTVDIAESSPADREAVRRMTYRDLGRDTLNEPLATMRFDTRFISPARDREFRELSGGDPKVYADLRREWSDTIGRQKDIPGHAARGRRLMSAVRP